jgi:hypothetical protein
MHVNNNHADGAFKCRAGTLHARLNIQRLIVDERGKKPKAVETMGLTSPLMTPPNLWIFVLRPKMA